MQLQISAAVLGRAHLLAFIISYVYHTSGQWRAESASRQCHISGTKMLSVLCWFFLFVSYCGRREHAARCEVYFYTSVMKYCRKKNTIVGWIIGSFSVFYVISPVICRDKSDARWELFFFLFALFPFVNRLPFHLSDPIIVFLSFCIGGSAKLKDIWYSKMVENPKIR